MVQPIYCSTCTHTLLMQWWRSLTGTKAQREFLEALAQHHNYDIDKVLAVPGAVPVDANVTAMEMIKATSRGDAELYYPSVNGISGRVSVVVRSLWPSLLHVDEEAFLKN